MNFSTEAIADLKELVPVFNNMGCKYDADVISHIIKDLTASTKFLLPPPDTLNVNANHQALKFLRLPYPICAFEYSLPYARDEGIDGMFMTTTKSTKRIALAYDCSKAVGPVPRLKMEGKIPLDSTGILVYSIYYVDSSKEWTPSLGVAYFDESVAAEEANFIMDNEHVQAVMQIFPTIKQSFAMSTRGATYDQAKNSIMNDVAEELATAVRACLMLNAKNLKAVKLIDAPVALNKKRNKSGKPPFFEYYTIDILVSQGTRLVDRKKPNYGAIKDAFTNMRNEYRWGTVIGHFKIRATGMFWWNTHSRGNKSVGTIQKDYTVTTK